MNANGSRERCEKTTCHFFASHGNRAAPLECLLRWSEVDWGAGQIRKLGKGGRLVTRPITPTCQARIQNSLAWGGFSEAIRPVQQRTPSVRFLRQSQLFRPPLLIAATPIATLVCCAVQFRVIQNLRKHHVALRILVSQPSFASCDQAR